MAPLAAPAASDARLRVWARSALHTSSTTPSTTQAAASTLPGYPPHLPGRRIYAAAGYAGLRSAEAYQETSAFEMDAVDTYHAFFDGREEADRDYLLLNGDARAERPHRSL